MIMNFLRNKTLLVVSVICTYCVQLAANDNKTDRAVRRAYDCGIENSPRRAFRLETLATENGRLVGTADYEYFWLHHDELTIDGVLTPDGRFWPTVTSQVRSDPQGEWKTVGQSAIAGKSATFTVQADGSRPLLFVDLEVFGPYAGKMQCARVVLQNSQAATFRLEGLQALKEGRETPTRIDLKRGWSVDIDFGGIPKSAIKPPLLVTNISESDHDLIATCRFVPADGKMSATVGGTKTVDGQLWLSAIGQVATDYTGVWMTVGKCTGRGEASKITLRADDLEAKWLLDLNPFRPWVGKYRYGRAVLENDVSAVFELKDILPP